MALRVRAAKSGTRILLWTGPEVPPVHASERRERLAAAATDRRAGQRGERREPGGALRHGSPGAQRPAGHQGRAHHVDDDAVDLDEACEDGFLSADVRPAFLLAWATDCS